MFSFLGFKLVASSGVSGEVRVRVGARAEQQRRVV